MTEPASLPINTEIESQEDQQEDPENRYIEATLKLLRSVSERWEPPKASLLSSPGSSESDGLLTPFESYVGNALSPSNFEAQILNVIVQRDNDNQLIRFLSGLPTWIFGQIAYEMGCYDVNTARTPEDHARSFLRQFGYVDPTDRKRPEGIFVAHELAEQAIRKLELPGGNAENVSFVIEQGRTVAEAIESALQALVMFYGQFIMPDVFSTYLQRKGEFKNRKQDRKEWWRRCQPIIQKSQIKQEDIHKFLVDGNTALELTMRILKSLNDYVPAETNLATHFSSIFGRETIFPKIDNSQLPSRMQGTHQQFSDLLESVKSLRNKLNHPLQLLDEGKVIRETAEVMKQVRDLVSRAVFFFDAGASHRLFPVAILATSREQNFRRQWLIRGIDEQHNQVIFRVYGKAKDKFLPDCEFFCWPPESIQSEPKITQIKLWRA